MGKQYDLTKEESQGQMVKDDTSFAYTSREQIVAPEYSEPSDLTSELPPYTMEELNARIDEAEEQIERGEVIDADLFFRQMHDRIAARV